MAWHLAGFDVVHGATRRPPEVTRSGLQVGAASAPHGWRRAAASRASTSARSTTWRAEAAERSLYVLDVRTPEEYEAGHLRGARLGAGRTAGAGNRQPHGDLGRARRAGGRQRRPRDHDRIVAEADGLARRRGSGRRSGGRRLGRPGRMCRASLAWRASPCRSIAATDLRDRLAADAVDRDRSRPEPAPCAGPYSRRLVRDPRAACATALAKLPAQQADRADVARRRAGAAGGGRVAGGRVRSGDGPGRRHPGLGRRRACRSKPEWPARSTRPTTSSCRRATADRTARMRCAST